jgi:hypothetical protein
MDDLPAVALTVKDAAGILSGTVTFAKILDDGNGPRIDEKRTSPPINPALDGKTFPCQVKNPRSASVEDGTEAVGARLP